MVEGPYVQDFGSNVCQVGFGLDVDQSYFVCGGEVLEEGESTEAASTEQTRREPTRARISTLNRQPAPPNYD